MIRNLFISLLIIILMSSQCSESESDDCHRFITVDNNSNKDLFLTVSSEYPDTITYFGYQFTVNNIMIKNSISRYEVFEKGNCMEKVIGIENEYGVLMFFIFDNEIVKTVPWETIVKNKMYLKKYIMTVDSLQAKDWTITYP